MGAIARLTKTLRAVVPDPLRATRMFVAANMAFLGLDILIAHLANEFAERVEWAPVVFSAIATPLLVPGAVGSPRSAVRHVDRAVGIAAIVVGVLGMVFHLRSSFFAQQTLHALVYSAPFVAPLSYVGVGLLLLLVHTEDATSPRLGSWILFLALGGFVGNFALSLLDHAQNGFFHVTEWIPVVAAAYAIGFVAVAVATSRPMPRLLLRGTVAAMVLQMGIGVLGAALHVHANAHHASMTSLRDRYVFGAPAFAPLLFANIALLALIGLWALVSSEGAPRPAPGMPATGALGASEQASSVTDGSGG